MISDFSSADNADSFYFRTQRHGDTEFLFKFPFVIQSEAKDLGNTSLGIPFSIRKASEKLRVICVICG